MPWCWALRGAQSWFLQVPGVSLGLGAVRCAQALLQQRLPWGRFGAPAVFFEVLKVNQLLTSLCPSAGQLPWLSRAEGWS